MRFFTWLVAVASVVVVGCSSSAGLCTASTCDGCCTEAGECRQGRQRDECGFGGAQCRACPLAEVCSSGLCVTPSGTGGGGGTDEDGGATGGGGGGDAGTGGGGGGSLPQGACAGTLITCGTMCVDALADPSNCGGCGLVCGQGQVCNRGTCAALPADCTLSTAGCGPGLSCDPVSKTCTAGCRLVTDCPMGATCMGGTCACPAGQHVCGQTCVPDDALASCGTRCAACVAPTGGTVTCESGACVTECPMGLGNDAGVCADTDECAVANGGCSADAVCTNTPGSRSCACKPGFTGDGVTCADVNECATNNGGCHVSAACVNSPGSYGCVCNSGFSGDGGVCLDVNECLTGNGGCATLATCANTDGGRTCTCPTGYSGNGVTCTDINECATNNGGCSANATCTNTPGSRTCACNQGYTGNGLTCTRQQDGESCAVAQVLTFAASTASAFATTVGFTNDHATTCAGTSTVGRDRVYSVSVPAGKEVRVTLNPNQAQMPWDAVLYLVAPPASNCRTSGTTCLASSDVGGSGVNEVAFWRNTATTARSVYAIIDAKNSTASGPFSIRFDLFD